MPAERPNIVIFMNDQMSGLAADPRPAPIMPNAERLAAEGLRFRRCYAPTAHCCPARATYMTGLYPSRHGVYNNVLNTMALHTDIYPGIPMWSDVMAASGYDLKYSGKWHVTKSRDPRDCGWDELLAGSTGRESHDLTWQSWIDLAARRAELDRPRQRGELLRPGWGNYRHYGTLPKQQGQTHDFGPGDYQVVTTGIEGLRAAASGAGPWCVHIGPNGPHDPYIIPEKYATMYDPATVSMPESWRDDSSDKPVVYQRQRRFWQQMSDDEQREAVAHYWGYCTMQDYLLGLALDALEETGQSGNTLVILTSDHGDYNGAHGIWMKGIPAFDEAYRVPLVMRWPAGIEEPGREVDEYVTLADIAPTLLEISGAEPLPQSDGRSLSPFVHGEMPEDWRDDFCSQMNGVELYYTQRVVRTKDWKYVFNGFDWDELYDLRADPHEMRNLAPRGDEPAPEIREIIREMCVRMWRFGRATEDIMKNPYATVSLAPFGPMAAFGL